MRRTHVLPVVAALLLALQSVAWGAVPGLIPYQGRLTDAAGNPISGNQSIRFSIHNAATAGAELWFEVQPTVTVANGLFTVDLGSVTTIPNSVFSGSDIFLEIKVGADAAMTPRQRLGTVAYSFRSGLSPGIAGNVATSAAMAAGFSNLTSITATFPTSGLAYVVGNAELFVFVPAATTNCVGICINDVSGAGTGALNYQCQQNPSGGSVFHETNSTTMRTFSVAAGAKTFFLVGDEQSGEWTAFRSKITVMFFPDAVGTNSVTAEPQPEPTKMRRVGNTEQ